MPEIDDLTPEQIGEIDDALQAGIPRELALTAAGVKPRAYEHYRKLATDGDPIYQNWMESMAETEAKAEVEHLKVLASNKEWRARLILLERLYPGKYGSKQEARKADEAVKEVILVVAAKAKEHDLEWFFEEVLDALAEADSDGSSPSDQSQASQPDGQLH